MHTQHVFAVLLATLAVETASSRAEAQYAPPPGVAPPAAQAPDPTPPQQYPPPQPYSQQLPPPPPPPYSPPQYAAQPSPPPVYAPPPPLYVPAQPAPMPLPYGGVAPRPVPTANRYRSDGEMLYLAGTGLVYGVGSGVWVDSLAKVNDPAFALLAPLALGAAVPIGLYVWDQNDKFDRGVPSSMATGMVLGGVEGMAISGLQWQVTGNGGPNSWRFPTWTSLTFVGATAGAVGGYAFGEWLSPDPRSLALIASGSGWGTIAGVLFGSGIASGGWSDGASGAAVGGFVGYNAGVLATGALSAAYVPSWQTIKAMWLGELIGTAVTMPVYLFYVNDTADMRHGLVANAVGGLAGLGIAAALTANLTDGPGSASWKPPFQLAMGPSDHGGVHLTAFGQF